MTTRPVQCVLPPVFFVPCDPWSAADVEPVDDGRAVGGTSPLARMLGRWTTSDPSPELPPELLTSSGSRTFIAWSGSPIAGRTDEQHETEHIDHSDDADDVVRGMTWMPGTQTLARDRLAAIAPRLMDAGVTLAVRPHAEHAISDIPALLWLVTTYPDGPYSIALDPVSMLTESMVRYSADHFRRCVEVGQYLIGQHKLAAVILPPLPPLPPVPSPDLQPGVFDGYVPGTGTGHRDRLDSAAIVAALSPLILAAGAVILQADTREDARRQVGLLSALLVGDQGSPAAT